jgi:hypothetical protein
MTEVLELLMMEDPTPCATTSPRAITPAMGSALHVRNLLQSAGCRRPRSARRTRCTPRPGPTGCRLLRDRRVAREGPRDGRMRRSVARLQIAISTGLGQRPSTALAMMLRWISLEPP